jgi:inosose dehydratase
VGVLYAQQSAHADGERRRVAGGPAARRRRRPKSLIVLGEDPDPNPIVTGSLPGVSARARAYAGGWDVFRWGEADRQGGPQETGLRSAFHPHSGVWIETPDETRKFFSLADSIWWAYVSTRAIAVSVEGTRFGVAGTCRPAMACAPQGLCPAWRRASEQGWDYDRSIAEGVFCELGQGDVDFPSVLAVLNDVGYDGWIVVEQDILPGMGSPRQSAAKSRGYLAGLGL